MSVTCSTSGDLLHWNVTHAQRTSARHLSYIGTVQMEEPIIITLTTLNVSRSLNNSSPLPLISMISTNNSKADLNGTIITCSGLSYTQLLATDSVEILLVGNKSDNVNSMKKTVVSLLGCLYTNSFFMQHTVIPGAHISEQFGTNSITVTLMWSHKNGVSYSVNVDPEVAVNYIGRNRAHLTVSYDTIYNVSVVASLCGIITTNLTIIYHGKLDMPK